MEIIPTLGPKVYKYDLLGLFGAPGFCSIDDGILVVLIIMITITVTNTICITIIVLQFLFLDGPFCTPPLVAQEG